MSQLFSVIDIETTGGLSKQEKITEIAIYVTDGTKIISEYTTLINPEKRVPSFITGLTGITNEMLEDAPKFYEVAAKIVEITQDTVFVAHNASFDYGFVKQEFAQLGYNYRRNTLCSVQLSRKIFPGFKSYSLGKICAEFNINIKNRHRAAGDAYATALLFNMLYKADYQYNEGININGFSVNGLNQELDISKVKNLPEKCGVYYFYNANKELIYIGKSKNIYTRVLSHLRNEKTNKAVFMRADICDVDYELTGCELIALLKESHEIKTLKPVYNKAQRRTVNAWGIFVAEDENAYFNLAVKDVNQCEDVCLNVYKSKAAANEALYHYCQKYNLCQKMCGLYQSAGACFYVALGECKGACCGKEEPKKYNDRVEAFISEISINLKNAFIINDNCDDDRIAVVHVKNNKYIGYGFVDKDFQFRPEELEDIISKYPDNKDVRQIIRQYLKGLKSPQKSIISY